MRYHPETVNDWLERERRQAEADDLAVRLALAPEREVHGAMLFAWAFTLLGLATALALYLIKFNHWFGVR